MYTTASSYVWFYAPPPFFNAPYQFTPLRNLRSIIFDLTPFGYDLLHPSLIADWNIILDLRFSFGPLPILQKSNYDVKQELVVLPNALNIIHHWSWKRYLRQPGSRWRLIVSRRYTSFYQEIALTFWRRNYYFFNFSTPVYKMWIREPNTLELWNKLHFEEKKTDSIYHV